ncbi:MAG TPA: IS5 family transposase [Spirochaetota bacterium]|nr:IS5 family transposase [Spirochaetota bacterium]HPI90999.1 IS5 family transposase [Spirochaetota bacterium]
MKQRGLFDEIERLEELTKLGDPLITLTEHIKWETFRPILNKIRIENPDNIKNAGRKPFDEVMMFRVIILQSLYGLSDDQMEFQLKDRRSFERFVSGGDMQCQMPDAKTIWLYKERFKEHGIARKVFRKFNHQLDKANLMARSGQIVDASFVEVPRQRNSRDDNKHIKEEGTPPEEWSDNKKRQKDVDARWTVKNKQKHFGYKNHIAADRKRKFIINYDVTSAEVHDSQPFFKVLGKPRKDNEPVWGDSAYRSEDNEKELAKKGFLSKIHEKGYRGRPLTERQRLRNTIKPRTRARVEHIFGSIHWFKGNYLRCIGLERITEAVGMINLAYNMKRYCSYA